MKGDRVRIGTVGAFKEAPGALVFVYEPRKDPNKPGHYLLAGDGTVLVESKGGVKAGESGTIQGLPVKVHRSQLKDYNGVPGLGADDSILVYPVFLDHYQQLGWFPVDNVKIMAGGR